MHWDSFSGEFYQIFSEELTSILHKLFQKTKEEGILHYSFYEATSTLIPTPHKDSNLIPKERKLQTSTSQELKYKTLPKNSSETNPATYKKIIYHDLVRLIPEIQGWVNTGKKK